MIRDSKLVIPSKAFFAESRDLLFLSSELAGCHTPIKRKTTEPGFPVSPVVKMLPALLHRVYGIFGPLLHVVSYSLRALLDPAARLIRDLLRILAGRLGALLSVFRRS